MNDDNHIFHTADLHFAARAARGRVEAINASPNLHWLVEVSTGDRVVTLTFDTAPSFLAIVQAAQREGVTGEVQVRSITVGRKRPRPLVLFPWQRVRHPIAAE